MNKIKAAVKNAYDFVSEHSTGVAGAAVISIGMLWALGYFIRSVKL